MNTQRIFRKDYESPAFEVGFLHLDFNLHEDFSLVSSKMNIRRVRPALPLVLDGVQLELVRIAIDGRDLSPAEYILAPEHLTLPQTPDEFTLEIVTKIHPETNTALEGLYKSNDIFCTQCEAQSFRKITYFLDRPDVMTQYTVRVEAEKSKYPVLLSNGDRVHVKDLGNGRHEAFWKDPWKKPCYLFALVAGDLGVIRDRFVTRSGRTVNLEIWAAHGKQDRCQHAMESLKRAMKWDEDTYGREYDLQDYMIVAIDDFNAGAMENKGLNIFNSRLVLADADSASDHDYHAIESVVAHEYFHNWTGNRVTLRDWFHLSLKEGLTVFRDQEFSADMTDRGVQRISDVDSLRERQFPEDAGPNSHPVRPESCLAVDNFFTMTIYEKGAELIRMMQTTVGRKGFRRGMDLYFERHDGQAVTTDNFSAAIADANQADFSILNRWYSQAGTPVVHVTENWQPDTGQFHLKLRQSSLPAPAGQPEKQPFQIPLRLGLLDSAGQELPLQCPQVRLNSDGAPLIELRQPEESFVFSGLKEKPHLSLLREFSAPVNLEWNRSPEDFFFAMAKDTDGFNRREAAQQAGLSALCEMIDGLGKSGRAETPTAYLQAWAAALNSDLDPAYQAALLSLPSNEMLAQKRLVIESDLWRQSRRQLIQDLARKNREKLLSIYRRWHGVDARKVDSKTAGHRALKNLALEILAGSQDPEILSLIARQESEAQNMTDRIFALGLLVNWGDAESTDALQRFEKQWGSDGVVLNKWFIVQSLCERPGARERVRKLAQHPRFQVENPNNVYSLLRVYGSNLITFHDPNEPGYDDMANKILEIDGKNPQVAARLCPAFQFTAKLPASLQGQAKAAIAKILAAPSLSKNTRELLK